MYLGYTVTPSLSCKLPSTLTSVLSVDVMNGHYSNRCPSRRSSLYWSAHQFQSHASQRLRPGGWVGSLPLLVFRDDVTGRTFTRPAQSDAALKVEQSCWKRSWQLLVENTVLGDVWVPWFSLQAVMVRCPKRKVHRVSALPQTLCGLRNLSWSCVCWNYRYGI